MVLHMCGGGTYFPYPNSTPLHASKNRGFGEEVGIRKTPHKRGFIKGKFKRINWPRVSLLRA